MGGAFAVTGARLICPFGASATLKASQTKVQAGTKPVATIRDVEFMSNITSFGMCRSLLNPQVAAATAAALGVLTPQPCMMAPAGTWSAKKPSVMVGGIPCLCTGAILHCSTGMGTITITSSGQNRVII